MRFGILGPFEVADDQGREVALGSHKQRAVLAILLLHAGEVVSSDRLIDELWGERAPATAAKTIQVYISKLRKALGDGLVLTRAGGYVLACDRSDVDVCRFEALVAEGRRALQTSDARRARRCLGDALALWRGQPLVDFVYEPFAQGEIARLEEARLAAVEDRLDADLALGDHSALAGELGALVREHPLRDRLAGQLMLALYRSGRQMEALDVYRKLTGRLREELGLEPSRALRDLERLILGQDPSLEPAVPAGAGAGGAAELGAYTFLFSDIEDGTRRSESDPEVVSAALSEHDDSVRQAIDGESGHVFKHTGNRVCAVFSSASSAVVAAVAAQRNSALPVRIAVHTGEAVCRNQDFFGDALNRCARLMEAAQGGQVLVSASSALVADRLPDEVELRDLGTHRLGDLDEPEHVFQVAAPALRAQFPPLRSLTPVRHNLPILRSAFIGRGPQLDDISQLLKRRALLTLTGIGGCGKTRLALEAVGRVVDDFPQGVFFVDLAVLSDPNLVGEALASALSAYLMATDVESLAQYLIGRRTLILLDNCEHLLDACAHLVGGLLARCPELHIVATSREPLGIDGEQVIQVPSLEISTEAVRLFLDRAQAAGAPQPRQPAGETEIAEICRRLDGIPLAVELAAARATHLSPADILGRLTDRFRLLTGGRRRVPRQQTLAATLDWSHDLLTEAEQTLFRRLSVFRGSFSMEEVEAICHPDAVDLLGSLVGKSLVNTQEATAHQRYRMLETVRVYAEQRLFASDEAAHIRSAHRDWLLGWVESLPVGQLIASGAGDQLVPEADNLSAAIEWSGDENRLDLIARLASRMIGYWWSYLRLGEMEAWWRILEKRLGELPTPLRAQALLVGVQDATAKGDFQAMERLSGEALKLVASDSWVAAVAWYRQALYWTYADPDTGKQCIDAGRKAAQRANLPEVDRMILSLSTNLITGEPKKDESLDIKGVLDQLLEAVDQASPLHAYVLVGTLAALGDTRRATSLAASLPTQTPFQRFSHQFLAALISINEARPAEADSHLQALSAIVREYALPLGEVSCLVGFAARAVSTNDFERASRLLACVRNTAPFPFRTPVEVLVYRQTARAVGQHLDHATAKQCRAQGAATSVTEAMYAELAQLTAGN